MTTRDFLKAVIEAHLSEDLDKKATDLLASMDAKNEKRKSEDSKEKKEVAARKAAVLKFLQTSSGAFTRDAIAAATDMKVGQAQAAALSLVADGKAKKTEAKIDKAKRTVYSIV